jgi:hypothetical protein
MGASETYLRAASAYADGARAFFVPGPKAMAERERAGTGPVPVSELIDRAETLAPLSAELAGAASAELVAEDPAVRLQASIALLAKALTDLDVSKALLSAAEEEAGKPERGRDLKEAERSAAVTRPADLDHTLQLLLGEEREDAERVDRGSDLPKTVEAARTQVADYAETTLLLIRDRAASTGWDALGGVAGIGVGKLAKAAGLVSMDVAEALGQAANLTRLYNLVRGFLGQAIGSIKSLLGPTLAKTAGDEVVSWIKGTATGKKFTLLVEKLYQTEPTAAALAKLAKESPANLDKFVAAIQGIDALEAAYRKQIELVGKILKVVKYVGLVPPASLPQSQLVLAAVYILVGGYVVLAGGDYVDAQRLKRIDRVPGVRKVLETELA